MSGNNLRTYQLTRMGGMVLCTVLSMVIIPFYSCGTKGLTARRATIEYYDGELDLCALTLRFAPRLYLHPSEPFKIIAIIPVFHPIKPIIAYHIFFEEDALFAGRGKEIDHEIVWVEYDPITLKISDVVTLWHRTVLRSEVCLMDAKASQQRPTAFIQWGQHGILPLGWERLRTARPSVELLVHYTLVKTFNRIPGIQNLDSTVVFQGSYKEYLHFSREVDAVYYLKKQKAIVAEHSAKELQSRIGQTFRTKKEWPFWSPAN